MATLPPLRADCLEILKALRNVGNYSPKDMASHAIWITSTSIFLPRRTLAFKQCIFLRKNRKKTYQNKRCHDPETTIL